MSLKKEEKNIAYFLDKNAKEFPYRISAFYPQTRDESNRVSYTHYTFKQLSEESSFFACGLEKAGIKKGDRVVFMVKPSLDFFIVIFGLFKAGVVPVIIDPGIGISNMKTCIEEAQPTAFIGIPKAQVARKVLGWGKNTIKTFITVGDSIFKSGFTLQQIIHHGKIHYKESKLYNNTPEDLAAIIFTSGSTGIPKGVVYNHQNFVSQIEIIRQVYDTDIGTVDLPTLPVFALFSPVLGITAVVPDMDATKPAEVDPKKIVEAIENFGVRSMFGSPALMNTVVRYCLKHHIKLKSLKKIASAGAPVSASLISKLASIVEDDAIIFTPYGATECIPISWIDHHEILKETKFKTDQGKGICVGRTPKQMEVYIIPITDEPIEKFSPNSVLPANEIGEITIKGGNVTLEYFGRPESNKLGKMKNESGETLHRTGDLGYIDDKGRIWFCGRKAHRVITKKGTLFTIVCEAIYNTHPDVYRSALVGINENGEIKPAICIELEPESKHKDQEKIKRELFEIASKYDHLKDIKYILFHPSFPVDIRHNSKIFREKLAIWVEEVLKKGLKK